jgi:hypothetical protein
MATKKTTSRKTVSKPVRATTKPRTPRRRPKAARPQTEKPETHHVSDTMREQLKKLGDKLQQQKDNIPQLSEKTREHLNKFGETMHEAKDKGVHVAKDVSDSMHKGAQKLGETFNEAKDKGVHAVKEVAEKIRLFAHNATELTKLKIDLHHLKKERANLFTLMGEQLSNLNKSKKLKGIKTKFTHDFKKLDELGATIADKEKAAKNFTADLKKIR